MSHMEREKKKEEMLVFLHQHECEYVFLTLITCHCDARQGLCFFVERFGGGGRGEFQT